MERTLTIPTLLTLVRLALAPWIGLAIIDHAWGLACALFLLAAITDALDGFLARKLRQESWMGACLDPVADKVLILTCYAALATASPLKLIPRWFVCAILFKDIVIMLGAIGSGIVHSAIAIRPTVFGKLAMIFQTIFVAWMLMCSWAHLFFLEFGTLLFSTVVGTSVFAFVHYSVLALRGWGIWFVRD
jgi:cardiolipin synthase